MRFFVLTILICFSLNANSFDQIRKGTVVSFGTGVNLQQSNLTLLDDSTITLNDAGSSVQFRMGSAVIKRVSLFSTVNQRNFFNQAEQGGYFITDVGVGMQYYFTSYIRTGYLMASASTAFSKFKEENLNIGGSMQFGMGYEIARNWQLELSWMKTSSDISHTLYDHFDSQSMQLTINYIWY